MSCAQNDVVLLNSMTQKDANDVLLMLSQNNIQATKVAVKDGYNITINSHDQAKALAILKNNGEPSTNYASLGEIFKKDGFISSPLEEHARFVYGLNQEISSMLSALDGIVSVRTEVSLPLPNDTFINQNGQNTSKVAVLIRYKQGARIDLYLERIRLLVSSSVPGVTPDQVQILAIPERSL